MHEYDISHGRDPVVVPGSVAGMARLCQSAGRIAKPEGAYDMIDLHYWPTPNGKKVTILLEEAAIPYKIVPCNIGKGDQFTAEFLKMNPNHRMPTMVDDEPADGGPPMVVFESGAI